MGTTTAKQGLDKILPVFEQLHNLFSARGFKLYLVGGAVRDLFMGYPVGDLDFTTDALPDDTRARLKSQKLPLIERGGGNYGTIVTSFPGVGDVEITTFRADKEYPMHDRRPVVEFTNDVTQDMKRRDFTMNAMYINYPDLLSLATRSQNQYNELCWYTFQRRSRLLMHASGQGYYYDQALSRILCTPQDPKTLFVDDPLRILRAYRFIAKYKMTVATDLQTELRNNAHRLKYVSNERKWSELVKILACNNSANTIRAMYNDGVLIQLFPELRLQLGFDQQTKWHDRTLWEHTLAVYTNAEALGANWLTKLACLLHDVAKPYCYQDVFICSTCNSRARIPQQAAPHETKEHCLCEHSSGKDKWEWVGFSYLGHEDLGADYNPEIFAAMSSHDLKLFQKYVRHHRKYSVEATPTTRLARKFYLEYGDNYEQMIMLLKADRMSQAFTDITHITELGEMVSKLKNEKYELKLPVDGNELMDHLDLGPGKHIGKLMNLLKDYVLTNGDITKEQALELCAKNLETSS